jgi:hypothetical protein
MEFCFIFACRYVMVIRRNIFRLVLILLILVLNITDFSSVSGQYVCVFIVSFIYMAITQGRTFGLLVCYPKHKD